MAQHQQEDSDDVSGWFLDADDVQYYVDSKGIEYYSDASLTVEEANANGIPHVWDEINKVPYYGEANETSAECRARFADVNRFGEIPQTLPPPTTSPPTSPAYHNNQSSGHKLSLPEDSDPDAATVKTEASSYSSHNDLPSNSLDHQEQSVSQPLPKPSPVARAQSAPIETTVATASGPQHLSPKPLKKEKSIRLDKKTKKKKKQGGGSSSSSNLDVGDNDEVDDMSCTDLIHQNNNNSHQQLDLNDTNHGSKSPKREKQHSKKSKKKESSSRSLSLSPKPTPRNSRGSLQRQSSCRSQQRSSAPTVYDISGDDSYHQQEQQEQSAVLGPPLTSRRGPNGRKLGKQRSASNRSGGSNRSLRNLLREDSQTSFGGGGGDEDRSVVSAATYGGHEQRRSTNGRMAQLRRQGSGRSLRSLGMEESQAPANYYGGGDDGSVVPAATYGVYEHQHQHSRNLSPHRGGHRGHRPDMRRIGSDPGLMMLGSESDCGAEGAGGPPLTNGRRGMLTRAQSSSSRRGGFSSATRTRANRANQRNLMRQNYAAAIDYHHNKQDKMVEDAIMAATEANADPEPEEQQEAQQPQGGRFGGLKRPSVMLNQGMSMRNLTSGSLGLLSTVGTTALNATVGAAKLGADATMLVGKTAVNTTVGAAKLGADATVLVGKTAVNTTVGAAKLGADATVLVGKTAVNTTVGAAKLGADATMLVGKTAVNTTVGAAKLGADATMLVGKTAVNTTVGAAKLGADATMLVGKTAVNTTVGAAKLGADAANAVAGAAMSGPALVRMGSKEPNRRSSRKSAVFGPESLLGKINLRSDSSRNINEVVEAKAA